ncbi:DNA-binding protein [Streptomyces sp. NBC_01568]|uniref:DNA-binding protein n=1 Tax=Streptomyces sp. NBC_01568 TaxID=2975882 RepID=UPI002F919B35
MIPHGRPVTTEDAIATARGLTLTTWRRREGADFRARVSVVNPGERLRLYDAAQADAFIEGRPIPATQPLAEPHPEDLLSDSEAGDVIGVSAATVRDYAAKGYLDRGIELHGRRWWTRRAAEERRDADKQQGAGGGWTTGDPRNTGRPSRPDPRVGEIARELTRAQDGARPPVTATDLATQYAVSVRTAERLLAAARQHPQAGHTPS